MVSRRKRRGLAGLLSILLLEGVAYGQTASSTVATSTAATVTPEELRLLEEALGEAEEKDPQPKEPESSFFDTVQSAIQTLNPNISVILDVAGAYFSEEPLQLGAHDPNRTGFTFQQLELHMDASVDPYFRFDTNIVFAPFGVEVEEAYATTLGLPWNLQVRAGQFLSRFGRINATHPHAWQLTDQPIVIGKFFGAEGNRGIGAELSWLVPVSWYAEVVGSVTDADGDEASRSFLGSSGVQVDGPEDLLYTLALEQFFPFDDDWSLFLGFSGMFGPNGTGNDNRTEIYGADLYLRYRPIASENRAAVSLQAEALYRTRQVPRDRLEDFGLYAQLTWNFTPRWETSARYEFVSGVENDPLDPEWTEPRQRASVALTFYPSHFSRIRAQGSLDDPQFRNEPIWAAILALEVLVGAHGAHEF